MAGCWCVHPPACVVILAARSELCTSASSLCLLACRLPCRSFGRRVVVGAASKTIQQIRAGLLCCDTANRYRRRSRLTVSVSLTSPAATAVVDAPCLVGKVGLSSVCIGATGARFIVATTLPSVWHAVALLPRKVAQRFEWCRHGKQPGLQIALQHSLSSLFPLRFAAQKPRAPAPPRFFTPSATASSTGNSFSSHHSSPSSL